MDFDQKKDDGADIFGVEMASSLKSWEKPEAVFDNIQSALATFFNSGSDFSTFS